MTNIIITCGTSIINEETAKNCESSERDVDTNENEFDKVYKDILKNIEDVWDKYLWAEISILKKIIEKENIDIDKVYFFFSDTNWWKLVKKLFEENNILKNELGLEKNKFIFYTISGFKNNADKFRNTAIPDFFDQLENIQKENMDKEIIVCPVGWYKSLIPYASLFAMIYGWKIKYLYENSDEILSLPKSVLSYYVYAQWIGKEIKILDIINKNKNFTLQESLHLLEFVNNFKKIWKITDSGKIFITEKILNKNPTFIRTMESLQYISDFIAINKNDLEGIKGELNGITNRLGKEESIEWEFIKDIIWELESVFFESDEIKKRFEIIEWYLNRNRKMETFLILRELYIDIFSYYICSEVRQKKDWREKIENQLNIILWNKKKGEWYKYIEDDNITEINRKIKEFQEKLKNFENKEWLIDWYEKCKRIRNTLAHIWVHTKDDAKIIEEIEEYVKYLKNFYEYLFA